MQELRSSYIGELKIGVTASYPLGRTPLGWRRLDRLDFGHFKGPRIDGVGVGRREPGLAIYDVYEIL